MTSRCDLCVFWDGNRCTNTFRLVIFIEPVGGQVDLVTTPGMVPDSLKGELHEQFSALVCRFLVPLIEKMPVWAKIREYQAQHPEAHECPGRVARGAPYLRVIKGGSGS